MAETLPLANGAEEERFLAFTIDGRFYAVPAQSVSEVIRLPPLARVPQAPPSLLGLGNVRGQVVPTASVRALVGGDPSRDDLSGLALLMSGAAPVALSIGEAPTLVTAEAVQREGFASRPGERLTGVFKSNDGVVHILDVAGALSAAFVPRARQARAAQPHRTRNEAQRNDIEESEKVIAFSVAGQEFALAIDAVREVIAAPDIIAPSPHSEDMVLGVTAYRDALLPLISLRGLLGLGRDGVGSRKVIVASVGGGAVGLVADAANAIIGINEDQVDTPPAILAARAGGESQIKAIYRGDGGRRLISILSPDSLFREDVMQRLSKQSADAISTAEDAEQVIEDRFVVFQLGEDEFALPIEAVTEVIRMPEQVTRVPKTPAFLEGVISYRGDVLPVVDQRRRFEMAPKEDDSSRRLVVVKSERHRAALIVDSVSEVLSNPRDDMAPAPDLAGDKTRLVLGVINLDEVGRMVMVLDPVELLSRAERGLLDAFRPELPAAK